MVLILRAGTAFRAAKSWPAWSRCSTRATTRISPAACSACGGETIDIFPAESAELALRLTLFDDEVETLELFDPLTGKVRQKVPRFTVYPGSHYVTPRDTVLRAIETIKEELRERVQFFTSDSKLVEAQRLEQRTRFDLEMLQELGFCKGIENYSRHLSGAAPGEPPPTLIDYLPADALMFIDESHVTIGQLSGMYRGDRSRKETLVQYGFRLPSALDNRPLQLQEFEARMRQCVFVSATPSTYEQEHSDNIVEQVVRPTGLVDPIVEVRPARTQVDDLLGELKLRVAQSDRVLVTTLTKRMAEDLTDFLAEHGVARTLSAFGHRYRGASGDHPRPAAGHFDVLVGINLLREGLDIPEVSLVAILDADKEGFLRSERSLIQTIGRAARNLNGRAILYADRITDSMHRAIGETERRRKKQEEFNVAHGITAKGVQKAVRELIDGVVAPVHHPTIEDGLPAELLIDEKALAREIRRLEKLMMDHARNLEFEQAAAARDALNAPKERVLLDGAW